MIRRNPLLWIFPVILAFSSVCSAPQEERPRNEKERGEKDGNIAAPDRVHPAGTDAGTDDVAGPARESQDAPPRARAAALASAMDDRLLAAQVIMAGLDGKGRLGVTMQTIYRAVPPGAIMLFRYNLDSEKDTVKALLRECSAFVSEAGMNGVAPFIAVDHEGGEVHRFGAGVEKLPGAASYRKTALEDRDKALALVEADARRSGAELRALGITMNLAPVAEILTTGNEAFLSERSYGSDAGFTRDAAAAFIRGMTASGVACVAKHFPGNSSDPHKGKTILDVDRETLDMLASPFAFLARAPDSRKRGPSGIMISHCIVEARDPIRNASLSPLVLRDWLRKELGFEGIALGDDFSMPAIALSGMGVEEAAVAALNAGLDMVMVWPEDIVSVHRAITGALDSGALPRERLREAAARILCEKLRFGLVPGGKVGVCARRKLQP